MSASNLSTLPAVTASVHPHEQPPLVAGGAAVVAAALLSHGEFTHGIEDVTLPWGKINKFEN